MVDGAGNVRAVIGINSSGSAVVLLIDSSGKARAAMAVAPTNDPVIAVSDGIRTRAGMRYHESISAPEISLMDDQGKLRTTLSCLLGQTVT